jgi:hypothetical protein
VPSVLIAGVVTSVRSYAFPAEGRPHCAVELRVPESTGTWRILAFDDQMPEAEALVKGDHTAVQGQLSLVARPGPNGQRLVAISVIASQFLPLRRRSPNRLPVRRDEEEVSEIGVPCSKGNRAKWLILLERRNSPWIRRP